MKKLRENILDVGLFLLAITFNPITVLVFVIIGASGCTKPEKNNIVWRVSYINTNLKMQDYIHSTTEKGCKCRYMPYAFGSDFYELPDSAMDSVGAVNKFYEFKDKETYVVYQAYPYCKIEEWYPIEDWEERKLITVRSEIVDTWTICQKFGLIDSAGHYIK